MPGLDREKQAAFWKAGAEEDLGAAARLLETGNRRHGLFFAHLAVVKALKGLATLRTGEVPPKSHDLLRLADVAGLVVDEARAVSMARLGRFCMEGRYPESFGSRARETADEWSDIDLVVVSPVFDGPRGPDAIDALWRACAVTGGFIEPVACGVKRWEEDDGSPPPRHRARGGSRRSRRRPHPGNSAPDVVEGVR